MDYGTGIRAVQRLFADIDRSGVAGLTAHDEFTTLENEDQAIAAHLGRRLVHRPVGVVERSGSAKVVPVEAVITRPSMPGAPELRAVRVAQVGQVMGQNAHFLVTIQANS